MYFWLIFLNLLFLWSSFWKGQPEKPRRSLLHFLKQKQERALFPPPSQQSFQEIFNVNFFIMDYFWPYHPTFLEKFEKTFRNLVIIYLEFNFNEILSMCGWKRKISPESWNDATAYWILFYSNLFKLAPSDFGRQSLNEKRHSFVQWLWLHFHNFTLYLSFLAASYRASFV